MRQALSKGMVAAAAATSILSLYSSQAFADSGASGVAADSPGVLSGNNVQAPLDVPVNACGNSVNVVAALNPSFGNSCATPTGKHRKPDAPRHGAPAGHGKDQSHASGHHGAPGHGHGHGHGHGPGHGPGPGPDQGQGQGQGRGHDGHGQRHDGNGQRHDDRRHDGHGQRHDGNGGPGHHHEGSAAHAVAQGSPGAATGNAVAAPVDVPVNACGNTVDVIGLLNPVFGNECGRPDVPGDHGDEGPKDHGDDGPKGYGDEEAPPSEPPATPPAPTPPTTAPPETVPPPAGPPAATPPTQEGPGPELAHTGSGGMLGASAAGMGLLLGGAILYRRNRVASRQW